MAKKEIPKTHFVVEVQGLYYCRCKDEECGECDDEGASDRKHIQAQVDELNVMEAISQDLAEEIKRIVGDYHVPVDEIIDYLGDDLWWLRDMVVADKEPAKKKPWSSYD